jgi:molybdopterin-guanine dinucleotide biosynthesis protein A
MSDLTIAVMAGGKSSRMGTDKAFVPLLGQPMIEHVLARVADLGQDHTILVANRPDDYAYLGLPIFTDVVPDKGALGGICTAIHHSPTAYTLVIACDMPFVNAELLRHMIDLRDETGDPYDVIVPRKDDHPQGVHAVYRKPCLGPIRTRIDADRLKAIGFYEDVRVRYLDPAEWATFDSQGLSFYNVNTLEELQAAQEIAAREPDR